jgi:hypothetical protein
MNSVVYFDQANDVFGTEAVEEARRQPAIRHFEGPSINKPWHLLCEWKNREIYFEHRRETPWPRHWPTGLTLGNVLVWSRRRLRKRE